MIEKRTWFVCLLAFGVGLLLYVDPAFAQVFGGSGFETRIKGFTNNLISVILPIISVLGLLYAAMLAASGDEGAKRRMLLVVLASAVGILAPFIIRWIQGALGG